MKSLTIQREVIWEELLPEITKFGPVTGFWQVRHTVTEPSTGICVSHAKFRPAGQDPLSSSMLTWKFCDPEAPEVP